MSMVTCEDHRDAIVVFNTSRIQSLCPLCEAESAIKDLETKVEDAQGEVKNLQSELNSMPDRQ